MNQHKYRFDYRAALRKGNLTEGNWEFDNNYHPNVFFDDLKVGMHLYMCTEWTSENEDDYVEIEITHYYAGVFFYKVIGATVEQYFDKNSTFAKTSLYPMEVISWKNVVFTCTCPKTKCIIDNDESTIGTYETTYKF